MVNVRLLCGDFLTWSAADAELQRLKQTLPLVCFHLTEDVLFVILELLCPWKDKKTSPRQIGSMASVAPFSRNQWASQSLRVTAKELSIVSTRGKTNAIAERFSK